MFPAAEEDATYDFFEINGLLFFFAYRADRVASASVTKDRDEDAGGTGGEHSMSRILSIDQQPGVEFGGTTERADISDGPLSPASASSSSSPCHTGNDSSRASQTGLHLSIAHHQQHGASRDKEEASELSAEPASPSVSSSSRLTSGFPALPTDSAQTFQQNVRDASKENGVSVNSIGADGVQPSSNSASPPDYTATVKFRSRVCRSLLWTDVGETGLIFDDCVVGGTYFKDFTIWNRSEIDLYWILNTMDLKASGASGGRGGNSDDCRIKFSDYDTGEPLDGSPIPAFSHRRIRVTFRPVEVGDFNYDVLLENANDTSNTVQILIHAGVRSVLREEALVVSSGNMLDFGECVAGIWSKQRIVLRNVSEGTLDVSFTTDNPCVVFQLTNDDMRSERRGGGGSNNNSSLLLNNASSLDNVPATPRMVTHDRLRDLAMQQDSTNSELSNTTSSVSSRASSPTGLNRKESEVMSTSGSVDFGEMALSGSFTNYEEELEAMDMGLDGADSATEESTRIEELQLRSGTERTVEVCYKPEKDTWTSDHRGGRFVRRTFRIFLTYLQQSYKEKDKKTIQCKARTCTSFIDVNPKQINFGDTDVGTLKSAPIHITNCSDMPARVELRYISKVLNTYRDEISLPPKQSVEVKIDIYPRKVNPDYRKQITVANLLNRDNDQIVEVRSTNIDKNRVTFHSLFYRILTQHSTNFIDFGAVVLNAPTVRTFTIDNISKRSLVLEVTSSMPDEILIFTKGKKATQNDAGTDSVTQQHISMIHRREKLLESISDKRKLRRPTADGSGGASGVPPSVVVAATLGGPPGLHRLKSLTDVGGSTATSPGSADYLDLASPLSLLAKEGRRSPKRKPYPSSMNQTLRQIRMHFRERKPSAGEEDQSGISGRVSTGGGSTVGTAGNVVIPSTQQQPRVKDNEDGGTQSSVSGSGGSSAEKVTRLSQGAVDSAAAGATMSSSSLDVTAKKGGSTKMSNMTLLDLLETSKLSADRIVELLENTTGSLPPLFPKPSSEEKYVRTAMLLRREFESMVADGRLEPVRRVEIAPENEETLIIVFTPSGQAKPFIQGKPRKQDARIFFRLVDFDRTIERPEFDQLLKANEREIPVRELMLRSSVCRSMMDLGQKNINFGVLDKGERRTKTILIRNNSEAPLLYAIRKSGSIASGDLVIGDGRVGVVRGYGKKEVEFMFDPSLPGHFHERLSIENVQDRENNQILNVKANIRKPANFFIQSLSVDFGTCLLNEMAPTVQYIVISNTSQKHTRTFEIRVDPHELRFRGCRAELSFDLVDDHDDVDVGAGGTDGERGRKRKRPLILLSKEAEEKIEHIEQKLKIAKRKGRKDKVAKLMEKLEKLRAGIVDDDYNGDGDQTLELSKRDPAGEIVEQQQQQMSGQGNADEAAPTEGGEVPREPESNAAEALESSRTDKLTERQLSVSGQGTGPAHGSQLQVFVAQPPKYKKTDCSIILPIEPRAIKTVSVTFRPVELDRDAQHADQRGSELDGAGATPVSPIESAVHETMEVCMGRIYVHEEKNTDVVKKVGFRGVVCYDHASYLKALAEDAEKSAANSAAGGRSMSITTGSMTSTPMTGEPSAEMLPSPSVSVKQEPHTVPRAPMNPSVGLSNVAEPSKLQDNVQSATSLPPPPPPLQPAQPSFIAELPVITLNKPIEIDQQKDCYFKLISKTDMPIQLVQEPLILDGAVEVVGMNLNLGELPARGLKRVEFGLIPRRMGRQTITFRIQNPVDPDSVATIVFNFYVIASAYLRFSSMPADAPSLELDLGYCYVDPTKKYSKVIPFPVENIAEDDLFLTVVSNLTQQCFIFADPSLETPVFERPLLKGGQTVVYIALQPYIGMASSSALTPRRLMSSSAGDKSQSNLSSQTGSTGNSSGLVAPAADGRTLIGGVKFMIYKNEAFSSMESAVAAAAAQSTPSPSGGPTEAVGENSSLFHLSMQVVKFSSIIGQSLMRVTPAVVDLGWTTKVGGSFTGSFTVQNQCARMPLEYDVICTNSNIRLKKTSGLLEGWDQGATSSSPVSSGSLPQSRSQETLEFEVTCDVIGLFSDVILVVNQNNSSQKLPVEVRLFVDPGSLTMNETVSSNSIGVGEPEGQRDGTALEGTDAADKCYTRSLPCLCWDDVYVTTMSSQEGTSMVNIQTKSRAKGALAHEKLIELVNTTEEILEVVPKSDLDITVKCNVPRSGSDEASPSADGVLQVAAEDVDDSNNVYSDVPTAQCSSPLEEYQRWRVCGEPIVIKPHQKASVCVSVPQPKNFTEDEIAILNIGRKLDLDGLLVFQELESSTVLKTLEILSRFCVSKAEIEPTNIDLGKVGYLNTWGDVKFQFTIKNLADIPFFYEAENQNVIDFIAIDGEQEVHPNKWKVDARSSQVVEAVFKPRQISDFSTGMRTFTLDLTNSYNPQNTLTLNLTAQLTLFELRFDRLVDGELVLPALHHPYLQSNPSCDTWFVIVNTSDEDVKFEINASLAQDVADFIRMEVLSRFSNSPLVGGITIPPQGNIEVRVRTFARENSRLPVGSSAAYLTKPDGVTFGTLRVSLKNQVVSNNIDDNTTASTRLTEDIPVRGVIVDTPIFQVSERRIEFRSLMPSDDEDEYDEHDERHGGRRPSTVPRFSPENSGRGRPSIKTQRETVYITNNSTHLPFEFKIAMEFPIEYPTGADILRLSPLEDDMTGTVGPGERYPLAIELLDPQIQGVSEDVKIIIIDRNSPSRHSHTLHVGIVEDTTGTLKISNQLPDTPGEETAMFESDYLSATQDRMSESFSSKWAGESDDEDETSGWTSDVVSSSSYGDRLRVGGPGSDVSQTRRSSSFIQLRGCKRISRDGSGSSASNSSKPPHSFEYGGLFELDLGQQDLGNNGLVKKIVLENPTLERVSYRLRTLSESDKAWIAFNRTEGTLEPIRSLSGGAGNMDHRDSHTITLNFMTNVRGVFSTYLAVENVQNPIDTKTVRINMEVVARQNIRRGTTLALASGGGTNSSTHPLLQPVSSSLPEPTSNHVFDVYVNGSDAGSTWFEMDNIFFDTEYSARSMVICNRESVPLEFTVKSNLSHDDPTELAFSLSRTSVKLFKTLTVDPESQCRVYFRFRPVCASPRTVQVMTLEEANQVEEKMLEIYVNCRLVKDYQKIMRLRALCRQPVMRVSQEEFFFSGSIRRNNRNVGGGGAPASSAGGAGGGAAGTGGGGVASNGKDDDSAWDIQLRPANAVVTLTNLTTAEDLQFEVFNDTMYFGVEVLQEEDTPTVGTVGSAVVGGPGAASGGGNGGEDLQQQQQQVQGTGKTELVSMGQRLRGPMWSGTCGHVKPGGEARIQLLPNINMMTKNAELLRREKCIVEQITIYNRRRPSEKYFIILKLSFSYIADFQIASGTKWSYNVLENHIVRILREIDGDPTLLLAPTDELDTTSTSTAVSWATTPTPTLANNNMPSNTPTIPDAFAAATASNAPTDSAVTTTVAVRRPCCTTTITKAGEIFFLYTYITDQLIHYGTREHASENYIQLATLLFG
ncbi:hypothetical protein HK102_006398 [Quaeritorhiza haematococci]|nr:hypothetical protein HK102_006398 [Quaeritorhiza haematococci]